MGTETHILHGDLRCMDTRDTRAEALAWRDGRLLAVGPRAAVTDAAGPGATEWDVGGATVLPGFTDAHQHPSLGALWGGALRLVPPAVTDLAGLLGALERAGKALEPGRWLVAQEWDEHLLAERRPPRRDELDAAVPDRPLLAMHYTCHRAVVNSRALAAAGITRHTPDPWGGKISRGFGALPDGLLIERAMCPVESLARRSLQALDPEGFITRLGAHHGALLASGITRVVDATVPVGLLGLYGEAARRGAVRVPTTVLPVSDRGYLEAPWDLVDTAPPGSLPEPLTVGPVKLCFDGAPVCALCLSAGQLLGIVARSWALALRQWSLDTVKTSLSVAPRLGRDFKVHTGIAMYPREEAEKMARALTDRGLGFAIHAIGNEAVDTALRAFTAAGSRLPGVARIEHAAFLDPTLPRRMADLGVAAVVQPHLVALPAVASAPTIPGMRYIPLRWLLDAGVRVAGSSDFPVAGFDPLDGVRTAVSRKTTRGDVYEPDQRVTLFEALTLYTRSAAEVCGCLGETGTLEVGKRADLVVLDRHLDEGSLSEARVRATVLGGSLAHGTLPPG
ncbi:MAG: amidohydrolase [Deltaproteobacteria bacterium]|nr:amidohydrolase [Deltaproteobacteria bacterium]